MKKIILPGLVWFALFFCFGYLQAMAQTTPDPGLMGPHTVIKAEYNLGNTSYIAPPAAMFPVPMEEIGSVHYPSDLTSGPFPVVVFLHGRHETCYDSTNLANTSSSWPCTGKNKPIPSYEGYDYLAKTLASNGYIVISISANCINATDGGLSDAGMNARGVLLQHHLDLWKTWNTSGGAPFGTTFVGKLDMQNIGTMGHSRGGEGIIFNAEYNRTLGSPYGIKALFTLAPVDFYRHKVNGIPLLDLSPYCDGDVNDNEGVHFYDDVRYLDPTDETPKHTISMMGADHNLFNTIWTPNLVVGGGIDDWSYLGISSDAQCTPGMAPRFDSVKQKAALNAYLPAFFRLYLGHETQFAPILEVRDIVPPVSSTLTTKDVYVSYHPGNIDRLDLNRIDNPTTLTTNTLTGAVTKSGLTGPVECGNTAVGGEADCSLGSGGAQEPHFNGLSEMKVQWNDTFAWYQNQLPVANQNLSNFKDLIFRACVNFTASTSGVDQNFMVQLIDSVGDTSSQAVAKYSHALFYQPGTAGNDLPKALMNTVSIPLDSFKGVSMSKIRYLRFRFNQVAKGAVLISDLAITNPVCGTGFNSFYKDSIGKKYLVTFKDSSYTNQQGDTLSWHWDFGDPSSGTKDTSSSKNPTHTYTAKGTYTACLYLKSKRLYSMVCTDTFCRTIVLANDEVQELNEPGNITIIPNPATTYLQISGAAPTDVLTLINLYGQVVLTTNITQPTIYLPQNLATGIYYAVVNTATGRFYQKILITR